MPLAQRFCIFPFCPLFSPPLLASLRRACEITLRGEQLLIFKLLAHKPGFSLFLLITPIVDTPPLLFWIKKPKTLTCAQQSKNHLAGKVAKAAQNAAFALDTNSADINLVVYTAFIFNMYPPKTEARVQQSCQRSYVEKKWLLNGCF